MITQFNGATVIFRFIHGHADLQEQVGIHIPGHLQQIPVGFLYTVLFAGIFHGVQQFRDSRGSNLCAVHRVCSLHQLVGFINDVIVAVQQHTHTGSSFHLLGCQQQVVIGNLDIIYTFFGSSFYKLGILAAIPVGALVAASADANLRLDMAGDLYLIQVEAVAGKIQHIQQFQCTAVFFSHAFDGLHIVCIPAQTEVMFLTFPNHRPQRFLDDTCIHQNLGQPGDLLLDDLPLQINAGSRDGDGIGCILVILFDPGCRKSGSQIAHGFTSTNTRFTECDLLSGKASVHFVRHLHLLLPNGEANLRQQATENHADPVIVIYLCLHVHSAVTGILDGVQDRRDHHGIALIIQGISGGKNIGAIARSLIQSDVVILHMIPVVIDDKPILESKVIDAVLGCLHLIREHTEVQEVIFLNFKHIHFSYPWQHLGRCLFMIYCFL